MTAELRKISYGMDSGRVRPYFLEFTIAEDGEVVERVEETFKTRREFLERMEGVIPIFDGEVE